MISVEYLYLIFGGPRSCLGPYLSMLREFCNCLWDHTEEYQSSDLDMFSTDKFSWDSSLVISSFMSATWPFIIQGVEKKMRHLKHLENSLEFCVLFTLGIVTSSHGAVGHSFWRTKALVLHARGRSLVWFLAMI